MEFIVEYCVVLVEPKYSGNVGAVARSMKNFGVSSLFLVNPCEIDEEARVRAMHAQEILDNARVFSGFEEVRRCLDYCAATSSVVGVKEKSCLRKAVSLQEFAEQIQGLDGRVGLVFGREDYGLYNSEIAVCDALVNIPTSEGYSSLNLSHAVAVVLYELFTQTVKPSVGFKGMGVVEKENLNRSLGEVLDLINYPSHKRVKAEIMLRRLIGKAMPSIWEYHTLMGIIMEVIRRLKGRV